MNFTWVPFPREIKWQPRRRCPSPPHPSPRAGNHGPDPSGELTSFFVLSVCKMPLLMLAAAAERLRWRLRSGTGGSGRSPAAAGGAARARPALFEPRALRGEQRPPAAGQTGPERRDSAPQRPHRNGPRPAPFPLQPLSLRACSTPTRLLRFSFGLLSVPFSRYVSKRPGDDRAASSEFGEAPLVTKRGARCHRVPSCCSKSSNQAQVLITVLCSIALITSQYPSLRKTTRGRLEVRAGDSIHCFLPFSLAHWKAVRGRRGCLYCMFCSFSKEQTRQGTNSSAGPSREQVWK